MAVDVAPVPRLALSVEEACQALGCSRHFWREHIDADVPTVRQGRKRLVAVAALEVWLEEHASLLPDDAGVPGYAASPGPHLQGRGTHAGHPGRDAEGR